MSSFASVPLSRRSGDHRSLNGRWNGLPPHNYAIQTLRVVPQSTGIGAVTATVPASGEDFFPSVDVSSRFGRRLRELRLQRKLTQSEMARKFGIDRSFISDVERGRKSISLPMIEVIALGMNLTLAKLFEDL